MVVITSRALSASDLRRMGNNLLPQVTWERRYYHKARPASGRAAACSVLRRACRRRHLCRRWPSPRPAA